MNEIRELTEMEVEAVSGGGLFDIDLNIAAPVAVAVGGFSVFGRGGDATAANLFGGQTIFHA
jgi:hypothetical protein